MPTKSTTHFAILGLLSIKPMSAYELVKFSKETIGFFWNESYGNIYRKLLELAKDGDITLIEDSREGRRKKTYAINAKGEKTLKTWLKAPPEEIIMRDELLLKLFISEQEDLVQVKSAIQQEKEEMTAGLSVFEALHQNIQQLDQDPIRKELWLLTLEYGKTYAQTRRDWCVTASKKISALERNNANE